MHQPLAATAVDRIVKALDRPRPAPAHTDMLDVHLGKYVTLNVYYYLVGHRWAATETSPGEMSVPHITKIELLLGDSLSIVEMAALPRDLQEDIDNAIIDCESSK